MRYLPEQVEFLTDNEFLRYYNAYKKYCQQLPPDKRDPERQYAAMMQHEYIQRRNQYQQKRQLEHSQTVQTEIPIVIAHQSTPRTINIRPDMRQAQKQSPKAENAPKKKQAWKYWAVAIAALSIIGTFAKPKATPVAVSASSVSQAASSALSNTTASISAPSAVSKAESTMSLQTPSSEMLSTADSVASQPEAEPTPMAVTPTPTENAQTQQQTTRYVEPIAVPATQSGMVWVGQTGTKYHSSPNCSNMNNPSQVTIEQAQAMGRTPCKKCH